MAILQYGLSVAFVGISVVFVGLVILIGIIKLMEIALKAMTAKKETAAPAPAPVAVSAPAAEPEPETDDNELIAVIAAAVACAMEAEGNASGFVVRSIRRINNAPAWNRAGREEQVYSRM